jgi:hypothetical protein
MAETNHDHGERIQTEDEALQAMRDEVQGSVHAHEWQALTDFHTYCAGKLQMTLEFYRRTDGTATYRFRPATAAEIQDRGEDWEEDAP